MATDTSERGLEHLICTVLAGHPSEPPTAKTATIKPNVWFMMHCDFYISLGVLFAALVAVRFFA